MSDPVEFAKDTAIGIATGGLSYVYDAAKTSIDTGSPMPLLTQGLDVGVAAFGNDLATDVGGPAGGMAFNLAGLGLGLAGGGLAGLSPTGFGAAAEGGAAIPGTVATQAIAPAALTEGASVATPAAVSPSTLTTVPTQAIAPGALPIGGMGNLAPASMSELASGSALNAAPSASSWFAGLSPGAQTALITGGFAGAQMVTGGMQGLLQGASAEKRLQLEQLINAQRQGQIQYQNKNNQYAPLLNFNNPGLANTPP